MSINTNQVRTLIIDDALTQLEKECGIPYSPEAVHLLLMTAAHESRMGTFIHQLGGPALGIYQMEPDTYNDIRANYISFRPRFQALIENRSAWDMVYDLKFATIMTRIHYWRVPAPMPKMSESSSYLDYLWNLGEYAKKYYNTELGKATVEQYVTDCQLFANDVIQSDYEEVTL